MRKNGASLLLACALACALGASACAEKQTYYQVALDYYLQVQTDAQDTGLSVYAGFTYAQMRNMVIKLESTEFSMLVLDEIMAAGGEYAPTQKYQDGITFTAEYQSWISLISTSVSYSCEASDFGMSTNIIKMGLSIADMPEDEGEFAKAEVIRDGIISVLPNYVEANIEKPQNVIGVNCYLMDMVNDIQTVVR